jgi:copper homeostasis protein
MLQSTSYQKEACVETLEQAIAAEKKGADRLELCADLHLDGLTPPEKLIKAVLENINIPLRVMIRPRSGNFLYNKEELNEIKATVLTCKNMGIQGVVFGALKEDKCLDMEVITSLSRLATPMSFTVHKAIDETPDLLKALKELSAIEGISGILTSGGAKTAFEGREVLKRMIQTAPESIEIIAAGRITADNLPELHAFIEGPAYHGKQIVGKLE